MLIIVDSGSTKADWQIIHANGSRELLNTMGFNPFFHDADRVESELKKEFAQKLAFDEAKHIYFYGAGCSDASRCNIIATGLRRVFPKAEVIEVDHDLLACARAVCGVAPGIACIIGTGSNTCLYDGKKITDNVSNLGFLLGDEGSGSHLGKRLIRAYFYRELPADLVTAFETDFPEGKRAILNKIYSPGANVYLASFATFISAHKTHFFVQELVSASFKELIIRHILKYEGCHRIPIHFVGSIAYHFQDILKIALERHNLKLGSVIKKPIDNLVKFHLEHLNPSYKQRNTKVR
jgi:N-acetylglucosamine kinase-like BadF-type ATPase